ncbi:MAG TPA: hypothetical protein VH540_13765 [Ktedonobacterales bacterium]
MMMRNIFIDEHLLLERVHEQQRGVERRLLSKAVPTPGQRFLVRLVSRLIAAYLLIARKEKRHTKLEHTCTTGIPAGQSSGD